MDNLPIITIVAYFMMGQMITLLMYDFWVRPLPIFDSSIYILAYLGTMAILWWGRR